MARRRVVDWKKASRSLRRQPWIFKLTWFGVLASVDDFGLCAWSPLQIGQVFMEKEINERKVSVHAVELAMEGFALGPDPMIVTWEDGGERFLAVRKHQDYQRVRLPSNADCPCPPAPVLQELSRHSRGLITDNLQKFTSFGGGKPTPEVEVEVEEEVEEEGEGARSRPAASGCPFCLRPTKGPLQHYHDTAKEVLKRCLVIDPSACGPLISRRERELGKERCHALFSAYLKSEDAFVEKQGYSLRFFCSENTQNGLAQALDGGYTHGSARGKKPAGNVAEAWRKGQRG